MPFFLFTILVAVGEDYNILLVHRAMQEQRRFGLVEGMRRALAKTGGAITSCGLIMAGTFATLMLAGLGTLLQIGFALAFGVLVDTFLVRPFLVPAFAILCWKAGALRRFTPMWPRPSFPHPNQRLSRLPRRRSTTCWGICPRRLDMAPEWGPDERHATMSIIAIGLLESATQLLRRNNISRLDCLLTLLCVSVVKCI